MRPGQFEQNLESKTKVEPGPNSFSIDSIDELKEWNLINYLKKYFNDMNNAWLSIEELPSRVKEISGIQRNDHLRNILSALAEKGIIEENDKDFTWQGKKITKYRLLKD